MKEQLIELLGTYGCQYESLTRMIFPQLNQEKIFLKLTGPNICRKLDERMELMRNRRIVEYTMELSYLPQTGQLLLDLEMVFFTSDMTQIIQILGGDTSKIFIKKSIPKFEFNKH